jgi:hypothetical protein
VTSLSGLTVVAAIPLALVLPWTRPGAADTVDGWRAPSVSLCLRCAFQALTLALIVTVGRPRGNLRAALQVRSSPAMRRRASQIPKQPSASR